LIESASQFSQFIPARHFDASVEVTCGDTLRPLL
jgi:hypothetical protein